jgi:hypothetical protein
LHFELESALYSSWVFTKNLQISTLGRNTDDEFLPHFACKATGGVLREFAETNPEALFEVYCGHTHSGGFAEILPNLHVYTAGAEYGSPRIERLIEVE